MGNDTSTIIPAQIFSDVEKLELAGFLAGYLNCVDRGEGPFDTVELVGLVEPLVVLAPEPSI